MIDFKEDEKLSVLNLSLIHILFEQLNQEYYKGDQHHILKTHYLKPVSYTHLDVYKRQMIIYIL